MTRTRKVTIYVIYNLGARFTSHQRRPRSGFSAQIPIPHRPVSIRYKRRVANESVSTVEPLRSSLTFGGIWLYQQARQTVEYSPTISLGVAVQSPAECKLLRAMRRSAHDDRLCDFLLLFRRSRRIAQKGLNLPVSSVDQQRSDSSP